MKRGLKWGLWLIALLAVSLGLYTLGGWIDARRDAPALKAEIAALDAKARGVSMLTPRQRSILLKVEDPAFLTHNGADWSTPGAGNTTITQGLAKKLAFTKFKPGLRKFRQTAYAMSLEQQLSKQDILTLFSNRAEFGRKANDREWVKGFPEAAQAFFGKPLSELSEDEYIALVATLVSPAKFNPDHRTQAFDERIARIKRLVAGQCAPRDHGDVMLEGCASYA